MNKVEPQDLSKITKAPAKISGVQGQEFLLTPINPIKVAGERGRMVKAARQDSFMKLVERKPSMSADVISSTLAKIEAQPYTMDTMIDELMTYDGMKFIVWCSVKVEHPEIKLFQVDQLIPDLASALKRVMEISGMSVPKDEADKENPTSGEGQTP